MRRAQLPGTSKAIPGLGRNESNPQPSLTGGRGAERVTPRVAVIHYEVAEGAVLAQKLRIEGFEAEVCAVRGPPGLRGLRENQPDAVLIDLMRMPSYGQWMAAALRERRDTRRIPIVFLEGDPKKTELVKRLLPDATFAKLVQAAPALRRAIRQAPADPMTADPSRIPLSHKFRIGPGDVVALLQAPPDFQRTLGNLPGGVIVQTTAEGAGIVLVFAKSTAALGVQLPLIRREIGTGRAVWLIWPKKKSGQASDLALPRILEMCAAHGLTGYKTCSVDSTWSAAAIAFRRGLAPAADVSAAKVASAASHRGHPRAR